MMFNPSVGVRIFDDVLLKFAAFMPPPTLPRQTSSSSSSSSSNNSPTISIGIASTKSLTSISGKRIDASSFAFIVVDIVMMSSSPSFPSSLVSASSCERHTRLFVHTKLSVKISLLFSLSLSLIKINQNESLTRNSCYTNTASSALPRLIAFRGSHQHVCVKARESARNFFVLW